VSGVGAAFAWAAAGAAAIYLATGFIVVWGRTRYDRRRQILDQLFEIVAGNAGTTLDPRARATLASSVLSRLPRRRVERIASEIALPHDIDEVVCRHLLDRLGIERVRRNSMAHRGERSRWSRIAALRVLAFGRPAEAWDPIERALVDSDRELVAAAVTILGNMRDVRAAVLLVKALRVGRYSSSRIAAFLDRFPNDLSGLIQPLLRHPGTMPRYWGAVLMRRYPAADGVVEDLVRLTRDEEPLVRRAAVETLSLCGGDGARAAARALLKDEVWFVRAHAARAMGALRLHDDAPLVTPLLADREWWVRYAAKVGLEAMGTDAAPHLVPLLVDTDRFARNGAAEVLQNLGTFERLLAEEAAGPGTPNRVELLRLLARAGGFRMSEAMVDRVAPEARGRAAALLASLGIERAEAGAGVSARERAVASAARAGVAQTGGAA